MALKDWSLTAADNATVADATYGNINWAENQNPNTVNDSSRIEMAHVRAFYETLEWRNWGHTVTRTSDTTFTVASSVDLSTVYTVGRRIRCTDASTLYGTISASSFAASTQTVTVSLDSGVLSVSLSAVALGLDPTNTPYGSRGSFTGTLTGCTTLPTGTCYYSIVGDLAMITFPQIVGVSNTTAATITGMPSVLTPPTLAQNVPASVMDNGATNQYGFVSITGTTITLKPDVAGSNFTASGNKGINACTVSFLLV